MKRDLKEQIKNLNNKELIAKIKTTQVEIQDLVLDKNMNKLTDRKAIFKKRKEVAILKTVLQQKELINKLEIGAAGPRAKKKDKSKKMKGTRK